MAEEMNISKIGAHGINPAGDEIGIELISGDGVSHYLNFSPIVLQELLVTLQTASLRAARWRFEKNPPKDGVLAYESEIAALVSNWHLLRSPEGGRGLQIDLLQGPPLVFRFQIEQWQELADALAPDQTKSS